MAEEVKQIIDQSEEEQIAALVKAKASKTPGESIEKKAAPVEDKKPEDKPEDKKPEQKPEGKKPELTEKEITAKVKELEDKDEKDLTDEDKKFLEDNKESDTESMSPDKFIEEEFGKNYEIKSMKDLSEFMETAVKVIEERDDLKAKLEAAEKKEPAYKSENQKRVAQFLEKTGYDPDKFPEGLMSYAQLMAMDLEDKNLSPKLVLESEYILDHPELTRDEARRKFEKTYAKKYTLNKDDFEKDDDLKEAEEDLRIEQKTAVAKAVKGLKKAQEEFKAQPSKDDKKDEKKAPEVDPVIQKGIEQSNSDLDKHLKENDQLIFSPTEDEDDDFPYQFKEDQLKGIRAVAESILKNPGSYDKKGKLLAGLGSGVEDVVKRVADFLYGDDIRDKLYEHAQTVTAVKRIEDIGDKKPDRKPKGGAAADIDLSEEKQIEILLEKKKGKKKSVMA
jgi:hypothetical protein